MATSTQPLPAPDAQAYLDFVFAWLAPRYLRQARQLTWGAYDRWLGQVAQLVQAQHPRRVLDIGCGPGRLLQLLRRTLPDSDLLGLDPVDEVLRLVPADVATQRGYLHHFAPRHRDAFDVVTMTFVLRDIPPAQRAAFLADAATCLAPGGRLVILETHTPQGPRAIGFAGYVYGWVPRWGRWRLTPDWDASHGPYPYQWLADTQRRWGRGEGLADWLEQAGLGRPTHHLPPGASVLLVSAPKPPA